MNTHLSEDQFARYAVGRAAASELEHIRNCAECSAELERFGSTLSMFRSALRNRIDERVALHTSDIFEFSLRSSRAGISKWYWALAAAALVVLVVLPFFRTETVPREVREQVSAETNADAIMDAVNRHLSRTVPAPMEPVMALIPSEELTNKTGGVQ